MNSPWVSWLLLATLACLGGYWSRCRALAGLHTSSSLCWHVAMFDSVRRAQYSAVMSWHNYQEVLETPINGWRQMSWYMNRPLVVKHRHMSPDLLWPSLVTWVPASAQAAEYCQQHTVQHAAGLTVTDILILSWMFITFHKHKLYETLNYILLLQEMFIIFLKKN